MICTTVAEGEKGNKKRVEDEEKDRTARAI